MPQNFNVQMFTNVLASALTSTVTAFLTYLAAWSHFSDSNNTALAAIIAGGLATIIGGLVTVFINRYSVLINNMAQGGTKVWTPDQKIADAAPNPNVLGPADGKVVKQ